MAFLLRQISQSAEGREIVRTGRIDDDLVRIGRDPASDIRLTDLAVALQHAVIERVSASQLGVSAGEGLRVTINGTSTNFGRIETASGGEIRIASHLLRIMPAAADAQDIEIVQERVTDADDLDPVDEERFSIGSVLPSKRVASWAVVLLVLAMFLAWPIASFLGRDKIPPQASAARVDGARVQKAGGEFEPDSTWTSGPLSAAHANLENNCTACHQKAFVAVRDDSCKSCHVNIHDHADPFRMLRAQPDLGTWGRVELAFKETFNLPAGRCVDCHTEHEGAQKMPHTAQKFCSDCHVDLSAKLPDTKLGNAGDFGDAHPQFKAAVITRWDGEKPIFQRVSLDAKPVDVSNLKFPHDIHMSKTGGVPQMARRLTGYGFGDALECKDCHDPSPDGVRYQAPNMEEDCGMCHSLSFDRQGGTLRSLRHGDPAQVVADLRDLYRARPASPPATLGGMSRRRPGETMQLRNQRQFQIGSTAGGQAERAIRAVFSPGGACYDCHTVEAPAAGSLDYRIKPVAFPVRYFREGWFDHKPHAQETCVSCHAATTSKDATDLLMPDVKSCRDCHGGEASASDVPSSCAMCHDYHMDQGAPSMQLRQQVRGKKKDTTIADTETKAGGRTKLAAR